MGKYDNVNDVRYFAFNASIRIWIFEERSEWDFKFLLKGSFLFCTHIFALVARIALLSISRKSSSMQGNHDQDNISTQKTGGLISRILFILKPSIGKETSQLVREEPMIDNDSHERGDRIRNKITSIIRDRTPGYE